MACYVLVFIFSLFLIVCLLGWCYLNPEARAWFLKGWYDCVRPWSVLLVRVGEREGLGGASLKKSRVWLEELAKWGQSHRVILTFSLVMLCMPWLLSLALSQRDWLDGYEDSRYAVNPQVAALLQGEQLVPPPPLPPELFQTTEVTLARPMLGAASRQWDLLEGSFTQRLLTVFKMMQEQHGYQMVIIEGYRSPERQAMLAKLGGHVTNAGPYQSYHQFGLAADCAFLRDGKLVISEKDPWAMRGYQLYGELAEAAGLTWGGRWKMMDFGHVEYRLGKRKSQLGRAHIDGLEGKQGEHP